MRRNNAALINWILVWFLKGIEVSLICRTAQWWKYQIRWMWCHLQMLFCIFLSRFASFSCLLITFLWIPYFVSLPLICFCLLLFVWFMKTINICFIFWLLTRSIKHFGLSQAFSCICLPPFFNPLLLLLSSFLWTLYFVSQPRIC